MHDNTQQTYDSGNTVRLQLHGRSIQAKIVKVFRPFTMAQAMVVQIFEPTSDLEGVYVLKIYDRRYSEGLRDDASDVWSTFKDMEFEKRRFEKDFVGFFQHLMASEDLFYDGDDYWSDDSDSDGSDDSDSDDSDSDDSNSDDSDSLTEAERGAYKELEYEVGCLKRYRAEAEVYRRMREHGIDGKDVPRFIGSVKILRSYMSKSCRTENSEMDGVPGILMQYVPGFSMRELYDTPSPPPRREDWKSIIDDGQRIVQYWMQKMEIRNLDDSIARNSVVHWDAIEEKWKCKLIDFGNCEFRQVGTRLWEWRREQAFSEEEQLCRPMEYFLAQRKGFTYMWELSQYTQELIRDFRMEKSTGIEPDGYESQSLVDETLRFHDTGSQSSEGSKERTSTGIEPDDGYESQLSDEKFRSDGDESQTSEGGKEENNTVIEPDDGYESQSSEDEQLRSSDESRLSQSSQSSQSSDDGRLHSDGYKSKSWEDEK